MNSIGRDVRYGARLLAKGRSFTAIALCTLALGIGAATSIFSVVDAVVFKPLPFRDPNRVVVIWEQNPGLSLFSMFDAVSNYHDWSVRSRSLEGIAGVYDTSINLTGGPNGLIEPEELKIERVSATLLPMLGVQMALGRSFLPEEDQPGGGSVVILSHALWERKFGADPAIVGKQIRLRTQLYTVVGVLPPRFALLEPGVEAYVPLALDPNDPKFANMRMLVAFARLKPGVTMAQSQTELDGIAAQLAQSNPSLNRGWDARLSSIQSEVYGSVEPAMLVLLGSVGLLLLMACANMANLLLARGASRQREIAVRAAVGATRTRLVSQFLAESAMLALAGGALGLLLARGAVALVARLGPESIPRLREARVDWRLFLFALAVSVATGVLSGLVPALQGSRANVSAALLGGGRGGSAGRSTRKLRSSLVVAEIALALVVLIGAGLLVRGFSRLRAVNPGFHPANVLTMRIPVGGGRNNLIAQRVTFFKELTDRIAALPGVTSVGAVSTLPLTGLAGGSNFWIEGRPEPMERRPFGLTRDATPGYFRAMGIPLLQGRFFDDHDALNSTPVAIIDQRMARRFWPQGGAVGGHIILNANDPPQEIVGVVGTVKPDRLEGNDWPTIYMPYSQRHGPVMIVVARTANAPLSSARAATQVVHDLDPQQPVADVQTMEHVVAEVLAGARFNMVALTIFAVIAFALATLGIYGVISYDVSARTNEIGIRMALGAQRGDVLKLVMAQGARLAAWGVGIGLVAALVLTELMKTMLFGVNPRDFWTFASISALLALVALAATYVPARRAIGLDPVRALRHE